jgi:glutamate carboxypeptidase
VELTKELTLLESPSTAPATQDPVFQVMARELEGLGFETRRLDGRATGGQLYAVPRNRSRTAMAQMIVGHVDTVWPVGTLEVMPVIESEGFLRGPGVFDMKAGLAQSVFALRALRDLGLKPTVTPVVFLNSDEEIGSTESHHRVRHLARRTARALVLEPALEPSGKLKTSRRGGGQFEIVVRGRSAHTGLAPGEGASAINELAYVIQALHTLSDTERGISVNVGEIQGGTRPNVVAAEARAVVDVRIRTAEDGRWLEKRIRAIEAAEPNTPGTKVEIRGGVDRLPMEHTPANRALWCAAREVGEALGVELEEGMSGGGSDGNTTSLFTATLDGLGAVGDGAHALHEYVEVDRMPERAALLAGILLLPDIPPASEDPGGAADGGRIRVGSGEGVRRPREDAGRGS